MRRDAPKEPGLVARSRRTHRVSRVTHGGDARDPSGSTGAFQPRKAAAPAAGEARTPRCRGFRSEPACGRRCCDRCRDDGPLPSRRRRPPAALAPVRSVRRPRGRAAGAAAVRPGRPAGRSRDTGGRSAHAEPRARARAPAPTRCMFSSSRTLPGQSRPASSLQRLLVDALDGEPARTACLARKWWTSTGMSETRSRSGGIRRTTTFRR